MRAEKSGSRFISSMSLCGGDVGQRHFIVLAAFIVLVAFTGGGARDDISSLMLVRPVAFGFTAYALICARPGDLLAVRPLLILLGVLAAWIAVQLIPLPPTLWQSLPQRAIYDEISNQLGVGEIWRPISLSPSKTLNSAFSLSVPLAALCLFAIQDRQRYRAILRMIMLACLASLALGVAQLLGGEGNALYTYRITNSDKPVGLLANRNHQAFLMTGLMILLAWYGATAQSGDRNGAVKAVSCYLGFVAMIPFILILGSRAGLLLLAPALLAAAFFVFRPALFGYLKRRPHSASIPNGSSLYLIPAIFILVALAAAGGLIFFAETEALNRLLIYDLNEDRRRQFLPVLWEMVRAYFPWGAGFGAFEQVYPQFERVDLLMATYLNQAHNDLFQFVIEGGLVSILLILAFGYWFLGCLFTMMRGRGTEAYSRESQKYHRGDRDIGLVSAMIICIFLVSSVIDYPLRVPLVMAIFALLCGLLSQAARHSSYAKRG